MQAPSLDHTTGVSANLHQILELILDEGLVIDLAPRISFGGIEILSVGARVVISSADSYLRHAEQIDKIGRPHHWDDAGAAKRMPRRTTTKKRYCRTPLKPPAALPRKRRKLKTNGSGQLPREVAVLRLAG